MIDDLDQVRRAKFVLDRPAMHRALGLPVDVRVVNLFVRGDPDQVHVVVEGPGVPAAPQFGVTDQATAAALGLAESPTLPHPFDQHRTNIPGWVLGERYELPRASAGD